jgi:hypothetical protein
MRDPSAKVTGTPSRVNSLAVTLPSRRPDRCRFPLSILGPWETVTDLFLSELKGIEAKACLSCRV